MKCHNKTPICVLHGLLRNLYFVIWLNTYYNNNNNNNPPILRGRPVESILIVVILTENIGICTVPM